jgi:hypothetical protein
MIYRIIGTVLFAVAMFFFLRFAWRKNMRDWEYIQESRRKHDEWMIECGRHQAEWEQKKRG